MKITAVASPETCEWLALSGVGSVHSVKDPVMGGSIIKQLLDDETIAIILVDPLVAESNSGLIQQAMTEQVYPIIVEIPLEADRESDALRDLIRYSVGIELEI